MTLEQVKAHVEDIKAVARDPERAHSQEDDLYEAFIRDIAEAESIDSNDLKAKAELLLETKAIEFERWCA